MSKKILFAGIDGSGKSTAAALLASRLAHRYRVTRVVNKDATFVDVNGKENITLRSMHKALQKMRHPARRYHVYPLFLIIKYIYKFVLTTTQERLQQSDLIIYEIDPLLHPAVYMTYHLPVTRFFSIRARYAATKFCFGSDDTNLLVFYLDTEPETAMQRILRRGDEVHAHENPGDLRRLKREFDALIEVARDSGCAIHSICTNDKNTEEVVNLVEAVVENAMQPIQEQELRHLSHFAQRQAPCRSASGAPLRGKDRPTTARTWRSE